MGDSFLRIYQQDEPGSAGFIAHLAKELQQPLTSLVNDGGASTLVRQELYRRPALLRNKRVVVWEFVDRDIRFGTEGWQCAAAVRREAGGVGCAKLAAQSVARIEQCAGERGHTRRWGGCWCGCASARH